MTTVWTNLAKHMPEEFLLKEDGDFLLLETGDKIVLNQSGWDEQMKHPASWSDQTKN
jgi:hypothetical protein